MAIPSPATPLEQSATPFLPLPSSFPLRRLGGCKGGHSYVHSHQECRSERGRTQDPGTRFISFGRLLPFTQPRVDFPDDAFDSHSLPRAGRCGSAHRPRHPISAEDARTILTMVMGEGGCVQQSRLQLPPKSIVRWTRIPLMLATDRLTQSFRTKLTTRTPASDSSNPPPYPRLRSLRASGRPPPAKCSRWRP